MKRIRDVVLRAQGGNWQERGQAMTELALAIIVLVLLLSIVLDMGRAFFTYVALQNAAGEGAYYGSAFPENVGEKGTTDKDTIIYRAQNESPITAELINWQNANFEVSYPRTGVARRGDPVKVRITYEFVFVGPLPHLLGTDRITLEAEAVQTTLASTEADLSSPEPTETPDPATAHIENIVGTGLRTGGNSWVGQVSIWVSKKDERVAPGIQVTGRWIYPNGTETAVQCTTGTSGSCLMPQTPTQTGTCVQFQVDTPVLNPHNRQTKISVCN